MYQKPTVYVSRLRDIRKQHGMTQAELARESGVSRYTIVQIETAGLQPTLKVCRAICAALDVTLDEVFGDDEI